MPGSGSAKCQQVPTGLGTGSLSGMKEERQVSQAVLENIPAIRLSDAGVGLSNAGVLWIFDFI